MIRNTHTIGSRFSVVSYPREPKVSLGPFTFINFNVSGCIIAQILTVWGMHSNGTLEDGSGSAEQPALGRLSPEMT